MSTLSKNVRLIARKYSDVQKKIVAQFFRYVIVHEKSLTKDI